MTGDGTESFGLEAAHESEDVLPGLRRGVLRGRYGTSDALDRQMGYRNRRLDRSPMGLGSRSHHPRCSVGLGVRTGIATQAN
jgi:hypothetical protein